MPTLARLECRRSPTKRSIRARRRSLGRQGSRARRRPTARPQSRMSRRFLLLNFTRVQRQGKGRGAEVGAGPSGGAAASALSSPAYPDAACATSGARRPCDLASRDRMQICSKAPGSRVLDRRCIGVHSIGNSDGAECVRARSRFARRLAESVQGCDRHRCEMTTSDDAAARHPVRTVTDAIDLYRRLEVALNEADWLAFSANPERRETVLRFEVRTLPAGDGDAERSIIDLRLHGITRIAASLRLGTWDDRTAVVVPQALSDLSGAVAWFGGQPIYGWDFFDLDDEHWARWRDRISIDTRWASPEAPHSLDVFQESSPYGRRHLDLRLWFT